MEWIYKTPDDKLINELKSFLKIDDLIARLLINRGIKSIEDADYYLNRNYKYLENPFIFQDMPKAVHRIKSAIELNQNILISGDRDTDGLTSISLLYKVLKGFGLNVIYSFPGEDQDYGFVPEIFDICEKNNINLVITVDNGISEIQNIASLREKGIDVILTDHHLPDTEIPQVDILLNPNVDKNYPCPYLSGCAVAFKFAQALILSKNQNYNKNYLFIELITTAKTFLTGKLLGINYIVINNFQILKKEKIVFSETEEEYILKYSDKDYILKTKIDFINKCEGLFIKADTVYIKNLTYSIDFLKELCQSNNKSEIYFTQKLKEINDSMMVYYSSFCKNSLEGIVEGFLYKIFTDDIEFNIFNKKFITITALSVIGDVMTLQSENRLIVKYGLNEINNNIFSGLNQLFENTGISECCSTAKDLAFKVIPVLNAARRMGLTDVALKTMLSENAAESKKLINELLLLNQNRKDKFNDYKDLVYEELYNQVNINKDSVFVVATDKIEHGVTGLIASKMKEEFNRPVIILIIKDNVAQGTARSVDNFHIVKAFDYCKELLDKYGGHRVAAGLSLDVDNINLFKTKINEYAYEFFKDTVLSDVLEIDAELDISDINEDFYNQINILEPFGKGNESPVFVLKDVKRINKRQIGDDKTHLRIGINNGKEWINGIGFGLGKYALESKPLSLAFSIEENVFKNRKSLQLNIKDIKV